MMRKPDKPALAKLIVKDIASEPIPPNLQYVIDGGALLHRVRWQKNAKFVDICHQYVTYVARHYGNGSIVVFDGYTRRPTTKDHEHQRRTLKVLALSPDIAVEADKPVLFDQQAFLAIL